MFKVQGNTDKADQMHAQVPDHVCCSGLCSGALRYAATCWEKTQNTCNLTLHVQRYVDTSVLGEVTLKI